MHNRRWYGWTGAAAAAVVWVVLSAATAAAEAEAQFDYRPVLLDGEPQVEILIDDDVVMRLQNAMGGLSPYQRAGIVVQRLQDLAAEADPETIEPGRMSGHAVVTYGGEVLVTIHSLTAAAHDKDVDELAYSWADAARQALGAQSLEEAEAEAQAALAEAQAAQAEAEPTFGSFRQVGIASWYGEKFHGRTTASGEVYNRFAMTAAHRTLPHGTNVRVTLLDTGDYVDVRINDRGPFIEGRIIDLSEQAAHELGMWYRGIAEVEVRVIE